MKPRAVRYETVVDSVRAAKSRVRASKRRLRSLGEAPERSLATMLLAKPVLRETLRDVKAVPRSLSRTYNPTHGWPTEFCSRILCEDSLLEAAELGI